MKTTNWFLTGAAPFLLSLAACGSSGNASSTDARPATDGQGGSDHQLDSNMVVEP